MAQSRHEPVQFQCPLRLKSYVSKSVRNGGFQVARWWDSGARKHNDHMGAFAVPLLLKSLN